MILLDGLRGEDSIAKLRHREGISQGLYYSGPRTSWKLEIGSYFKLNTDEVQDPELVRVQLFAEATKIAIV
jgi:hypothetical protein